MTQINLSTKQKRTHRLVVAKGVGCGGGMDWDLGISRCKPLYIGWINNKVLLYSIGNYIQKPVINHNGKGYEKVYMCIHPPTHTDTYI